MRSRAQTARQNIAAAFPEMTPAEHEAIAREHFRHLGRNMMELLQFPQWNRRFRNRVAVKGQALAEQAAAEGRGLILFIPHTGNWEILAAVSPFFLPKPMAIAQPMKHPRLEKLVSACRSATGLELTPREGALKKAVKALKQGRAVGFLADQDAGPRGTPVRFFGRTASAERSPVALARKLRCPLLLCAAFRNDDGSHTVHIEPAPTGDNEQDALQAIYARLEEWIRRRPSQWLWTHRRWKTELR